jgi:hypothetical protein
VVSSLEFSKPPKDGPLLMARTTTKKYLYGSEINENIRRRKEMF